MDISLLQKFIDTNMHIMTTPIHLLCIKTNIKNRSTSRYDFMDIQALCMLISEIFHITSQHWFINR